MQSPISRTICCICIELTHLDMVRVWPGNEQRAWCRARTRRAGRHSTPRRTGPGTRRRPPHTLAGPHAMLSAILRRTPLHWHTIAAICASISRHAVLLPAGHKWWTKAAMHHMHNSTSGFALQHSPCLSTAACTCLGFSKQADISQARHARRIKQLPAPLSCRQ